MKRIYFFLLIILLGTRSNSICAQNKYLNPWQAISAISKYSYSESLNMELLTEVRLPNAIITNKGSYFVAANTVSIDGKASNGLISRSTDNGKSWFVTPFKYKMPKGFVYDKINDAIFFINHVRAWRSTDDGISFSEYSKVNAVNPLDSLYNALREQEKIKAHLEFKKGNSITRYAYELTFSANPCLGIQLSNGVLVMPFKACIRKWKAVTGKLDKEGYPVIDRSRVKNIVGVSAVICVLIYSNDYGQTWHQKNASPIFNKDGTPCIIDEVSIAEVEDNRIMINARGGTESWLENSTRGRRVLYQTNKSKNIPKEDYKIESFKFDSISDGKIWDPLVHAAFSRCEYKGLTFWLFCNCHIPGQYRPRKNLMLKISADGHHWTDVMYLTPLDRLINGYCSIYSNNNQILFCYEDKEEIGIKVIDLTRQCINRIIEAYNENIQTYNIITNESKE